MLSNSGVGRPAALHSLKMSGMPRPHASISPLLKNTLDMTSLMGSECGRFRKSSAVVPGGKLPGFINSMRSSYMATLGVRAPDHQVRWTSRFRVASPESLDGDGQYVDALDLIHIPGQEHMLLAEGYDGVVLL